MLAVFSKGNSREIIPMQISLTMHPKDNRSFTPLVCLALASGIPNHSGKLIEMSIHAFSAPSGFKSTIIFWIFIY
jgi:hypothetical protein